MQSGGKGRDRVEARFGPLLGRRACGDCTACCTVPAIAELAKPADMTCVHCVAGGCGIYEQRPGACRTFFCGWRRLAWLPTDLRPDQCGFIVMLEVDANAANPFDRVCLVARWIDGEPDLANGVGARFLALARSRLLPVFVSAPGSTAKSLVHPGPEIYWPVVQGVAPDDPAQAASVAKWRHALS